MTDKRMNEITEKQKEQERLDIERIKLKSEIDNIRVKIKDNKITKERDEEWLNRAVLAIKIKQRKLKYLNLKRENLKNEIGKLNKELKREKQSIRDNQFERKFIANAKAILDKELYEAIRDKTLKDLNML